MTSDESFLRRLAEHPDDDATRLVYADWLEERGDSRAEYLRLEVELARTGPDEERHDDLERLLGVARRGLDTEWLARAGRAWDLVLLDYDRACKIAVIKSLRELTGCGLAEGKGLSESLPAMVLGGATRLHAEHGRGRLQACCTGEVRSLIRPSATGTPVAQQVMRGLRHFTGGSGLLGPYSLLLLAYPPEQKIHLIRVLRELTGHGLAECKARVEAPRPIVLLYKVSEALAHRAREQFGAAVDCEVVKSDP